MERRGLARPSLNRNMSSFSSNFAAVTPSEDLDLRKAFAAVALDTPTKEIIKADIQLTKELRDEYMPTTPNPELIPVGKPVNRYHTWKCGFSMELPPATPSSIPTTKAAFLEAVRGELKQISFLKSGLSRYVAVLHSGQHPALTQSFVDKQHKSTTITLAQLDHIEDHFREILTEVEASTPDNSDTEEQQVLDQHVRLDLQEQYGHACPWLARVRAIIVHSHVFYKINYALAADTRKEKK